MIALLLENFSITDLGERLNHRLLILGSSSLEFQIIAYSFPVNR